MSAASDTRAPCAARWEESRGRLHAEPPSATRTPFQRDRDRIIHCTAFRRLMHKTQVFVSPETDHYRTRLTHSLEVSQIARSMARTLGLDEDLTEALALSHDLGHPPFGHSGEDALQEVMAPYEGFDHNDQSLRILVKLERRYPGFEGLNLSWETLEGVVKHNGPQTRPGRRIDDLPPTTRAYVARHDLELDRHAGLEAQIAGIADDIAYNHHDMDDGLRAGLFSVDEVCAAVPHVAATFAWVGEDHPGVEPQIAISEVVRRLIGEMVTDVVAEARRRLLASGAASADDVRRAGAPMVAFSEAMQEKEAKLKSFLFEHMYRNPRLRAERERGQRTVSALFECFRSDAGALPPEWRRACDAAADGGRARVIADYIAGMTDRYARREAERLGLV